MDYFSSVITKAQAAVDQTLGIDEAVANEAMEASMTEGDMLSVIAGKEGAAKLSETTKKLAEETTKTLAETSKKVVEHVKEGVHASPGGLSSWGDSWAAAKKGGAPRESTIPKPDDFFSDFSLSPGKKVKGAGADFDDFDFPAPARPASKKAGGASPEGASAAAGTSGGAGDQCSLANASGDEDAEGGGLAAGVAADDAWDDAACTPTPGNDDVQQGWGDQIELPQDIEPEDSTTAADPGPAEEGKRIEDQELTTCGASSGPGAEAGTESASAELSLGIDLVAGGNNGSVDLIAQGATRGDGVSAMEESGGTAMEPAADDEGGGNCAANKTAAALSAAGVGECTACKGREASLSAAVARLTRMTELKDSLRVKLVDVEKAKAQMHEALERKSAQLQGYVERQESLEIKAEEQKQLVSSLQAEVKAAREASADVGELARRVKELEADKTDLFNDGKRIMDEKYALEKTIKALRQQLKDREQDTEKVKDGLLSEQARIQGYEERYVMATEQMEKAKAAMEAAKTESARKTKLLDERDKEWTALQKRLSALEKTVELLGAERDTLQERLKDVTESTHAEAEKRLERDRKHLEKDAAERIEMLTDSLETMQAALRRAEAQSAAREQRLREEVEDLQRRCQEAEQRSQDLSSSVPEATRPLLRQIDSLQSGAVEKQRVWDQLEQQLRQRCADAESEARAAAQRESIASERLQHLEESLSQAEMRIMSLQAEVSRLSAEYRGAKDELGASQRAENDVSAELAVARSAADRRAQELTDLKAAHRQREEEDSLKFQQERDRLNEEKAALVRQVRGLEASVKALKEVTARGGDTWSSDKPLYSASSSSAKPFDLSIFPLSPKGATLDVFDVSDLSLHREMDGGLDAHSSAHLSWQMHDMGQGGGQHSQVAALQNRLSALEQERDALADELAVTVTLKTKAERDAGSVPALLDEISALGKQYQLTLELLGATEEEVDDMRMTLAEVRLIYRAELERLMDAIPADHRWSVPAFPSSVRAKSDDQAS